MNTLKVNTKYTDIVFMMYLQNIIFGWAFWSLAHYAGHRKWHADILQKKHGVANHGENQHHVIYDHALYDPNRDPFKAFVSFPYEFIVPIVALFSIAYGHIFGFYPGLFFFAGAFVSMTVDDRAHRSIHTVNNPISIIQKFHLRHNIHHKTHTKNFAFITGVIWDVVFGTYQSVDKSDSHHKNNTSGSQKSA